MDTPQSLISSYIRSIVLAVGIGIATLAPVVVGAHIHGAPSVLADQGDDQDGSQDPSDQSGDDSPTSDDIVDEWIPVPAPPIGHLG